MPKGCRSQAPPYKNSHVPRAEKAHTPPPAITEPQLSHRSLLREEAVKPTYPVLIQEEVLSPSDPTTPASSKSCGYSLSGEEILAFSPSPPYHTSHVSLGHRF